MELSSPLFRAMAFFALGTRTLRTVHTEERVKIVFQPRANIVRAARIVCESQAVEPRRHHRHRHNQHLVFFPLITGCSPASILLRKIATTPASPCGLWRGP